MTAHNAVAPRRSQGGGRKLICQDLLQKLCCHVRVAQASIPRMGFAQRECMPAMPDPEQLV